MQIIDAINDCTPSFFRSERFSLFIAACSFLCAGHVKAKLFNGGFLRVKLADYLALVHNKDAVGNAHDLVKLERHQKHRMACVTHGNKLLVDILDGADVKAARRLNRDEQLGILVDLASDDGLLLVAAGHAARRCDRALAGADVVLLDELIGILAYVFALQKSCAGDKLRLEITLEDHVILKRVIEHKAVLVSVLGDMAHAVGIAVADRGVGNISAAERNFAFLERLKPGDTVDKLRLAVAVDAGNADDLACVHLEGHVLDGVVMMLTGTDEGGVQIGEFGSSEGYLDENIMWGRPGCPDKGEIFIKGNIVVQEKTNMERRGPMAAHTAFDIITQEIREVMKELDDSFIVEDEELKSIRRPGKKKVVIVKEIMGQGAMHDNFILPVEPVGILGARANVDLGNVPVCVSPLEVLDGCIHALTCIGPASKEMSRHYWREPLVLEALHDEEVDLCGVIFVGSPQINAEKYYVSRRVGHTVEMMDVDGAFVTTEGFGNNHIDFASHHEQIGMRGIPVVGLSFCAVQGALVVGNKYMQYMVDNNKSESGIENEVLGCNTLCQEEGIRALAMLKAAMAGEEVKAAEKKWNPNVKSTNVELIEAACGKKIELVDNEQSLPMSQKRKEKYD